MTEQYISWPQRLDRYRYAKVVFILVQLFVADLKDEVVGNSIDDFPLEWFHLVSG